VKFLPILFDYFYAIGYYVIAMAKSKRKKRLARAAEEAQRGAAALAALTKGRARTFANRKREANRKACRGKVQDE